MAPIYHDNPSCNGNWQRPYLILLSSLISNLYTQLYDKLNLYNSKQKYF